MSDWYSMYLNVRVVFFLLLRTKASLGDLDASIREGCGGGQSKQPNHADGWRVVVVLWEHLYVLFWGAWSTRRYGCELCVRGESRSCQKASVLLLLAMWHSAYPFAYYSGTWGAAAIAKYHASAVKIAMIFTDCFPLESFVGVSPVPKMKAYLHGD